MIVWTFMFEESVCGFMFVSVRVFTHTHTHIYIYIYIYYYILLYYYYIYYIIILFNIYIYIISCSPFFLMMYFVTFLLFVIKETLKVKKVSLSLSLYIYIYIYIYINISDVKRLIAYKIRVFVCIIYVSDSLSVSCASPPLVPIFGCSCPRFLFIS